MPSIPVVYEPFSENPPFSENDHFGPTKWPLWDMTRLRYSTEVLPFPVRHGRAGVGQGEGEVPRFLERRISFIGVLRGPNGHACYLTGGGGLPARPFRRCRYRFFFFLPFFLVPKLFLCYEDCCFSPVQFPSPVPQSSPIENYACDAISRIW